MPLSTHPNTQAPDVLVIGAGPAGIASAYALQQAGIRYQVIDRARVIGSTWHNIYPSLHLNTTRFYSHLPGKRFPLHHGIFPTGRQYHLYLEKYVAAHEFNIRLGIVVHRVWPQNGVWCVETNEGIFTYPVVISATGVFGNPIMPDIPGLKDFKGMIMHAHDFQGGEIFTGKRILVVGNGPSGIDISIAAAHSAQNPVLLSIRTGIDLRPRYPYGLPRNVWMLIGEFLPKRLCEWLQRKTEAVHYRLPEHSPLKPLAEQESGAAIPYRGPELIDAVHAAKVLPVRASICFTEDSVQLADGTIHEIDAVVLATGYLPVLHQYLDIEMQFAEGAGEKHGACDWEVGPNGIRGWPLLDRSQHPNGRQVLGYAGLYIVGTFYKGKGAMYNFNVEAQIAAEQIRAYLAI